MKNSVLFIAAILLMMVGNIDTVSAQQLSKQQEKALQKDVKKRVKQLKEAGWDMLASTQTMDYALMKYRRYIETDEENRIPITGIAIGRNNKIGRENAIHAGITSYSGRAKAQVVGKMKSVISSDANNNSQEEIDRFGAAYESGVNARISGLVREHFVLIRTGKDGSKEFNVFMSIDETAARKAREEAARLAKQEVSLGQLSDMVEDFIGEPVAPEE